MYCYTLAHQCLCTYSIINTLDMETMEMLSSVGVVIVLRLECVHHSAFVNYVYITNIFSQEFTES